MNTAPPSGPERAATRPPCASATAATIERPRPAPPLARARGAEVGVRTVRIPHLQSSVALWTLSLDSELIFIGDAGNTEAGRPSHRYGVEWANYYAPRPWLMLDFDLALSSAHFTDDEIVDWLHRADDSLPGTPLEALRANRGTEIKRRAQAAGY